MGSNYYEILTGSSAKIDKSTKYGHLTGVVYMIPSDLSGLFDGKGKRVNLCAGASAGCIAACLVTSGRAGMCKSVDPVTLLPQNTIIAARQRRTEMWVNDRDRFVNLLLADVDRLIKRAEREGLRAALRINGTSDLPWWRVEALASRLGDLVAAGKLVTYDYTKCPAYFNKCPDWHDLTLSRSERNADKISEALAKGHRVAVVFEKDLPDTWEGYPVVDGDAHDLCFLHPGSVVLGLKAKGRAKKDQTGFTVRNHTAMAA